MKTLSTKRSLTPVDLFTLFGAVLIWSAAPLIMKVGLQHSSLESALLVRFVVSSIIFLPWILKIVGKAKKLPLPTWFLFSGTILTINFLQMRALSDMPASWYLVIFSLNPVITLALLRTALNKTIATCMVGALIGTLLFINLKEMATEVPFTTWLCMFGGMLAWASYTFLIPSLQSVYSDIEITALTAFAGLGAGVLGLLRPGSGHFEMGRAGLFASLSLGLLFPLAYFLFARAIRRNRVVAILSQYLEPVIGLALAALILGEQLQPLQYLGSAIIFASMAYLGRSTQNIG